MNDLTPQQQTGYLLGVMDKNYRHILRRSDRLEMIHGHLNAAWDMIVAGRAEEAHAILFNLRNEVGRYIEEREEA